jgi:DNA-3-methyladenine glycosylase I
MEWLRPTSKGDFRCWWPGEDVPYQKYHDSEWGVAVTDDQRLYEKICLEGFQAGLSWLTILRKRENFRKAFSGFDIAQVARFDERDVERLVLDAGIVRHRGKIEATINNAARAAELIEETGSLAQHFWSFAPTTPKGQRWREATPIGTFHHFTFCNCVIKRLEKTWMEICWTDKRCIHLCNQWE